MLTRRLMNLIPPTVRASIRPVRMNVGASLVDVGHVMRGEWKNDLVPPTRKIFGGSTDYAARGFEYLHYFTHFGELKPHENVLDIGCGIGRMARPLTCYLTTGSYTGMDIMTDGLDWCQQNVTPEHPNFKFQKMDVYSKYYNPTAAAQASEYKFPFPDESFDFILLTSVFTHLMRPDMENYISEISRLLTPGGRLFSTWFLLNDNVLSAMKSDKTIPQIVQSIGEDDCALVLDKKEPERQIGFFEDYIFALFAENGLEIKQPINYGQWYPRTEHPAFHRQDIMIARK